MRIVLKFSVENDFLILPINYNQIIQGFIYSIIDRHISEKYHNSGFKFGKRNYKLFVFSRLISSKVFLKDNKMFFKSPVLLKIGSLNYDLIESLSVNVLKDGKFKIGKNLCFLNSIEIEKLKFKNENTIIKIISPITVHRGYSNKNTYKTKYFTPFEKEFSQLIKENLVRKATAYFGDVDDIKNIDNEVIKPIKVSDSNEKIITYVKSGRKFTIKGWMGMYKLKLNQFYLKIAYSSGLGARNSLGFGMFDIIKFSE